MSIARIEDPNTLLIVSAGTSIGRPAPTAACRAGAWPAPACSTCPMITYSTSPPSRPLRSRPARIASAPSSVAEWCLRPPPSLPNGVRTAEMITVRLTPFSLAAAVQEQTAVVVVDRHDVELAQEVGAEEALHAAVRVSERQVRLHDGGRRQLPLADPPVGDLDRRGCR